MARLDEATRLTPSGDGRYEADLDPEWTVGGRPHGGYLLAILGRAALAVTPDHPNPLSASAVYASSPSVGPAGVEVSVLREGRLASQVRARLTQGGKTIAEAHVVTGQLEEGAAERFTDAPPPAVAPFEECVRAEVEPWDGFRLPMLARVNSRIAAASFLDGRADLRGWLSFDDEPAGVGAWDPLALLYTADSFPPPTMGIGSFGWVPTLELTVYLRAIPAPGPLRLRQRARVVTGGLVDVVCEAWDSRDRVVLQSTQLAAVRMR
jgi:hypothetical protein